MGGTKRQFNNLYNKFSVKFKHPFSNILRVIKSNFTDEEFILEFKFLYPHLWNELESEYNYWKSKNDILIGYGKKSRYDFPKPKNFLLYKSFHLRQKAGNPKSLNVFLDDTTRIALRNDIVANSQSKLKVINKKKNEKLTLTQELYPKFLKSTIDRYFGLRSQSQEVINEKLEIIREAGNYKSSESVEFLQKVNAKELNFELKQVAIKMLQNMNEKALLGRKRQGKKKKYIEADFVLSDNPESLFSKLYHQMKHFEVTKTFDVFLSHSSMDRENIIEFYKKINSIGLHVYIDWVNDKYPLKRDLVNENTAKAILQRLSKSKVLICYISESSIHSQWTLWEIGYFSGLGKPVLIYNPQDISLPVFLKIYQQITVSNAELLVQEVESGNLNKLQSWMEKCT